MSTTQRPFDRGTERARSILLELGREIRIARIDAGLSQSLVARQARTSRSQVSRIERGEAPRASLVEMSRLLSVVGLRLSARAYPHGQPVRDEAHASLLDRLRRRVAATAAWQFEVPIGPAPDGRAWDAVITCGRTRVAVEAETRPSDLQALQRRLSLKQRDDGAVAAVVLLLSDTAHNRRLLGEHRDALRVGFPATASEILRAVTAGRAPDRSGIVVL